MEEEGKCSAEAVEKDFRRERMRSACWDSRGCCCVSEACCDLVSWVKDGMVVDEWPYLRGMVDGE